MLAREIRLRLFDTQHVEDEHDCRVLPDGGGGAASWVSELRRDHHEHLGTDLLADDRLGEARDDALVVRARGGVLSHQQHGAAVVPGRLEDPLGAPQHTRVLHDDGVTVLDRRTVAGLQHGDAQVGRSLGGGEGEARAPVRREHDGRQARLWQLVHDVVGASREGAQGIQHDDHRLVDGDRDAVVLIDSSPIMAAAVPTPTTRDPTVAHCASTGNAFSLPVTGNLRPAPS